MKTFSEGVKDLTNKEDLIRTERLRLEEETFQKLLDDQGKHLENMLKLMDKMYEEQHKRRKASLDVELGLINTAQKLEIAALGDRGLKEAEYIKAKEEIEKAYFERNRIAIESYTKKEIEAINSVYAAKKLAMEQDTSYKDAETKKAALMTLEVKYKEQLVAAYKEQLAALSKHIGEKVTEHAKYKTAYDAALKEIKKAEDDFLKESIAANKKANDDKIVADKQYAKDVAGINLEAAKQLTDIVKLKRDALQATMTDAEKARDKELEYQEIIKKGYEALRESERATDSITKKEKAKIAQDYFKEALGLVKEIAKEEKKADGEIIVSKEEAQRKQIKLYDGLETAFGEYTKALLKAAETQKNEMVAKAEKEKEDLLKVSADKKDKLILDNKAIAEAAEKNMVSVSTELKTFKTLYEETAKEVGKLLEIKADTTQTFVELKKLVEHITNLKKDKSLEIVLTFMGKASTEAFLGEKIIEIQKWITDLGALIVKLASTFTVDFKGNDNGWFWLGSLIASLIGKMNDLFVASNRTATFTIITKRIEVGGGSSSSSDGSDSGGNVIYSSEGGAGSVTSSVGDWAATAGGYGSHAEGGPIPGTGEGDTVPAMLTPGEFVIRKSAVQTFGEGFFHMVNRMKSFSMPKFNMGGIVQAFANGGSVRNNEIFTLNLQAGAAALPLKVMGNPANMRQQIRQFEKELSKMRLSHA